MKLDIELYGNCCNDYPFLTIKHNDVILYNNSIIEHQKISFLIDVNNDDIIEISGIGKNNGENGIWDTKLDDAGTIVEDKFLLINNIIIDDDIPMGERWIRSINNSSNGLYSNGSIKFIITTPILDWIICEKFIKFENSQYTDISWLGSGEGRFEYSTIANKISSIKKLLND